MKHSKKRRTSRRSRKSRRSRTPGGTEEKKIQNLVTRILVIVNFIGTVAGTVKISRQQLLSQDSYTLTNILVTLVSFIAGLGIGTESSKLILKLTEGFHDIQKIEDIEKLEDKVNKILGN